LTEHRSQHNGNPACYRAFSLCPAMLAYATTIPHYHAS
jgi:hypothetical protein